MKRILLITILFLATEFNHGFASANVSTTTSKPLNANVSANLIGYFIQNGVEYTVWVYLPDIHIARLDYHELTPPYYSTNSPSISGTYEPAYNPFNSYYLY